MYHIQSGKIYLGPSHAHLMGLGNVADHLDANGNERVLNSWTPEFYGAVKPYPEIISQVIQAQRSVFQASVISVMHWD